MPAYKEAIAFDGRFAVVLFKAGVLESLTPDELAEIRDWIDHGDALDIPEIVSQTASVVRQLHNAWTDRGFDMICDRLGSNGAAKSAEYFANMAIGWGANAATAFAAGQTNMQGANQDRNPTTYAHTNSTKVFTETATWGANDPLPAGTAGIEEIGMANSGNVATNDVGVRQVINIVNKEPQDTFIGKYTVTASQQ